ncbi:hypothetical protein [Mycobacterium sp. Root265]|nr:hypothetical protein [Mycobacterium sp. Root265]
MGTVPMSGSGLTVVVVGVVVVGVPMNDVVVGIGADVVDGST